MNISSQPIYKTGISPSKFTSTSISKPPEVIRNIETVPSNKVHIQSPLTKASSPQYKKLSVQLPNDVLLENVEKGSTYEGFISKGKREG